MTQTVRQFLNAPQLALLPTNEIYPALPAKPWEVTGMKYPNGAQLRFHTWNRESNAATPMPVGVTFNAPRSRLVQT